MSFDPNSEISDIENLFRAFHLIQWNHDKGRPSRGLFISSGSISVDRDGERSDDEVIISFRSRDNYGYCGLVKHTAKYYRECDTNPIPDPEELNKYHVLVNGNGIEGTKLKHAKKLCREYSVVIMAQQ